MTKFTKTSIFFLILIIIFILLVIFINQYSLATEIYEEIMSQPIEEPEQELIKEQILENVEIIQQEKTENWQIEIPKIGLNANISEGTTQEILNKYVGHFENTSKQQGNIGLAAHNRGYDVNYFKDLKMLKQGDEIIYKYNNIEKTYVVEKCRIIKDTEWQYLEETEDNILTLITCVENQPEYRRCVQAIEKIEEE